jgi:AcrR family transcriptional regulator
MTTRPTRRRPAGAHQRSSPAGPDTRAAILAAATRLLATAGADGVTMRAVGARVGITAMAIYRHFADRHALLDALHDRGFAALATHLRVRVRARTPERRLLGALDAYLDFALRRPREFDLMFVHRVRATRRFPDDYAAGRSEAFGLVATEVAAGMQAGVLRTDDVLEATLALWSAIHGFVMLHRGGRFGTGDMATRRLARRCLGRLLTGLRHHPGAGRAAASRGRSVGAARR